MMFKRILFFLVVLSFSVFAQMNELEVMPHSIHFMNQFERLKTVRISNYSSNAITVDSISFDSSVLRIQNIDFKSFPVTINHDSSKSIDVIVSNSFSLQGEDSTLVISLFSNSSTPVKNIDVKIDFKMEHKMSGEIRGNVKDSTENISDAKIYFFYDGIYLIDSTTTDTNGDFKKEVQNGNYFVTASKEGYYIQYGNLKDSPLDADFIAVKKDSPAIVNFELEKELATEFSISGAVYALANDDKIDDAIIVVRPGTHTPTKIQSTTTINPFRSYTVFTNSKGEYMVKNIQSDGDYYVEAFSQYYIPGYYNHMNEHETFWQNADSIEISGTLMGKDIYLERDSSYGGGVAKGKVKIESNSDTSSNSLIYALSNTTNKVYNYNFSNSSGDFDLSYLPSGSYKLVTDKIGYENSESDIFTVDTTQDTVANLTLVIVPTSVKRTSINVETFSLSQNYPNPFNPSTTIKFTIEKSGNAILSIYNLLGQKIAELFRGNYSPGTYEATFDATNLPSGTYIYRLEVGEKTISKKMMLLK